MSQLTKAYYVGAPGKEHEVLFQHRLEKLNANAMDPWEMACVVQDLYDAGQGGNARLQMLTAYYVQVGFVHVDGRPLQ